MTEPSLNDVVLDPEWLPHTYDVDGTHLTFVLVPRDARGELMFLSDEHFAGNFRKLTYPASAVTGAIQAASRAPMHFIFHTSFCCSTLLAKALEVPGVSSALKEPDVLINLANRLIRSNDSGNQKRLDLVLRLLERSTGSGETIIVKPTNFANRLMDPVLTQRPDSRAILLYSDLDTFLRSLLKRGIWGRINGRKLYNQIGRWSPLLFGYNSEEILELTDLQIAALGWLMQIHHFNAMAKMFGPQRVMVLDAARLLAEPATVLQDTQHFFQLKLQSEDIESIIHGPVFSTHSKFGQRAYDARSREEESKAVSDAHAEELAIVRQWIDAVAKHARAPLRPTL